MASTLGASTQTSPNRLDDSDSVMGAQLGSRAFWLRAAFIVSAGLIAPLPRPGFVLNALVASENILVLDGSNRHCGGGCHD
jgi:hypothetical protein